MNKLLVVCGPTGVGKTELALRLAHKFKGDIISADSRQVYKEMDIGTGKDLPEGARYKTLASTLGYYEVGKVRIWGYDLVTPVRSFSVAAFVRVVNKMLDKVYLDGKLPILVGGTGLYIKGVVDGIPSSVIPTNKRLRSLLEKKSTDELFEKLAQVDALKAASLNASDKKNPRRLVRALEIAYWNMNKKSVDVKKSKKKPIDAFFVGLTAPKAKLFDNVEERIALRVRKGIEKEINKLIAGGVKWDAQSMDTLGYKEWKEYFTGQKPIHAVLDDWNKNEKRYIKRQLVWFNKDRRIEWFDITSANFPENVEKKVFEWYIRK